MSFFKTLVLIVLLLISSSSFANTFESLVMPGEVISGHEKIETKCSSCHELFSSNGQNKLCLDCHEDTAKDIKRKKGYHGNNKSIRNASCKSCHTEHKGRDADVIKLDTATFNHNLTDFRLKGKHRVIECKSCHKKDKPYREAKSGCNSCHKEDNPHKKAKAKKDTFKKCLSCHQEKSWHNIKFDHDKKTKFKLTGSHSEALCQSCHINEKYIKTPKTCYSCHKSDDVHDGDNGDKCEKCHNTKQWGKISFNHDKDTSFKLRFKHKKTPCSTCHKNVKISKKKGKKKKARKCNSCHSYDDDHNGRFGNKCNKCHTDKQWDKTKFKHDRDTKFKIKGKHIKVKCNQCHTSKNRTKKLKTNKIKTSCVSCHKSDDIHKGSLGAKCQSCHIETGWDKKVKFDHDLTPFPLIGMHGAVTCDECHTNSDYKNLKNNCVSCHKNDDNHKGKMGNLCGSCHTPNDWGVWVFDHNKQSKFKLRNAHKRIHCHTCHTTKIKIIDRIPRDCRNCHSGDDIHNGQFGSRCNDCHTTKDFFEIRMK